MASIGSSLWYEFMRIPTWALFNFGYSLRCVGGKNIPMNGPALLVANHQSFLDPLIVGLSTWRHLRYLGRATLFRSSLFAKLIRSLGCVPIDQDGFARDGITLTLDLLKSGEAVLMFPEGERTPDGEVHDMKPGMRLLLRYAPVPVIPIGIAGAFEAYPRHQKVPGLAPIIFPSSRKRIGIVVGEPIDPHWLLNLGKKGLLSEMKNILSDLHNQAELLRQHSMRTILETESKAS